jgi:hypothetical protein
LSRKILLTFGLIAFAAIAAFFAVEIPRQQRLMSKARAKAMHERALQYFQELKSNGKRFPVIDSPELMLMIANDPACAQQLTYVHFDMTDLNAPEFEQIQKLPNVAKISFYDCEGITTLLGYASNMPSVNEVHFDYIRPSDELLQRLASIPNLKTLTFNDTEKDELGVFEHGLPHVKVQIYDQ